MACRSTGFLWVCELQKWRFRMAYGVLIGRVVNTKQERDCNKPHYQVYIDAGEGRNYQVPINVRSIDNKRPKLLYIADDNYNADSINILPTLAHGFHKINYRQNINREIAVDYVRSNLFNPNGMKVVGHNEPGRFDDLNEFMDHYIRRAMNNELATIYVYGMTFPRGVHNVHMNQGNFLFHRKENDIYHDGCILLHYADSKQWVAIFLAFQSQSWCTDQDGNPEQESLDSDGYPMENCRPEVDYSTNATDTCHH